jgi:hypothetical protein
MKILPLWPSLGSFSEGMVKASGGGNFAAADHSGGLTMSFFVKAPNPASCWVRCLFFFAFGDRKIP